MATPPTTKRQRLDLALVARDLCESREQAKRYIMAGQVDVNAQRAAKPSDLVDAGDELTLREPEKYVSRGGFKLEHALAHFGVEPVNKVAVDLGASTGGFTDCLLQHGATKVYAVDVGRGQLAWALRRDRRVVVMERTNARHLRREHFPSDFAGADLVTIDCSFISLKKILPPAIAILRRPGTILALVKPQFEAGKAEADKGRGVITDPTVHRRVLDELQAFTATEPRVRWRDATASPLQGPAGNTEFLAHIETK